MFSLLCLVPVKTQPKWCLAVPFCPQRQLWVLLSSSRNPTQCSSTKWEQTQKARILPPSSPKQGACPQTGHNELLAPAANDALHPLQQGSCVQTAPAQWQGCSFKELERKAIILTINFTTQLSRTQLYWMPEIFNSQKACQAAKNTWKFSKSSVGDTRPFSSEVGSLKPAASFWW